MTVIQEISELVEKMIKSGMEIPDFVLVGYDKWHDLNKQSAQYSRYTPGNSIQGKTAYNIITIAGPLAIHIDPKSHPNHLSIGRMTLHDFLIEEAIFDEEPINNSNTR